MANLVLNESGSELLGNCERYLSTNFAKSDDRMHLMEVRMHHATLDYRKMAMWTSLWMKIFNVDRYRWREAPTLGRVMPGGNCRISASNADEEDIFTLLDREGIVLEQGLAQLLRQRRFELKPRWEQAVPNRVQSWDRAGWYAGMGQAEDQFSRPRLWIPASVTPGIGHRAHRIAV